MEIIIMMLIGLTIFAAIAAIIFKYLERKDKREH